VAYFARFNGDGIQLIPAEANQTDRIPAASGVVLSIVEPQDLAGQVITFHFDWPGNDGHYQNGILYDGQIRRDYIGTLGFRCDPGFTPSKVGDPLRCRIPDELRHLLYERSWNEIYVKAAKSQLGDKLLSRALYDVLTDTSRPDTRYEDQRKAAHCLRELELPCPVSASVAMGETFGNWDEAVGDWPLYLRQCFGRESLLHPEADSHAGKDFDGDWTKLDSWRYWLGGDSPASENGPFPIVTHLKQ